MDGLRGPLRAVVRFAASVLMVSGALLVLVAVVTLLWQEPVSSSIAQGRQSDLEEELGKLAESKAGAMRGGENGRALGRISMPTLGRSYVVVEGVGRIALHSGPGHYPDTALPGRGKTVAIAGHRTTYLAPFRTIDRLGPGDPVILDMPYGRFVYRVEDTRIVPPTETEVKRDVGYDRLVLTACHPLYSAKSRIVVFARLEGSGGA